MSLLVRPRWLQDHLADPNLVIADVRWNGTSGGDARAAFESAHIPGAVFLDLDEDISDRSDPRRGRHPLPDPQAFVDLLRAKGIAPEHRIVAYDDVGGSIAARLWWMMRWISHNVVSLLDGGLDAWQKEDRPVETSAPRKRESTLRRFEPVIRDDLMASLTEVESAGASGMMLVDARAPERFRGEVETIDFKAGHIPGAINIPWKDNLTADSPPMFRSPDDLRARFVQHGIGAGSNVVGYCGSGVTACHNLFALELAGISGARLYPGSWSEWIHHH